MTIAQRIAEKLENEFSITVSDYDGIGHASKDDVAAIINAEISPLAERLDSMTQDIQLALCCIAGGLEEDDPDALAERHPSVAGALRVLLPYAEDRTREAIKPNRSNRGRP